MIWCIKLTNWQIDKWNCFISAHGSAKQVLPTIQSFNFRFNKISYSGLQQPPELTLPAPATTRHLKLLLRARRTSQALKQPEPSWRSKLLILTKGRISSELDEPKVSTSWRGIIMHHHYPGLTFKIFNQNHFAKLQLRNLLHEYIIVHHWLHFNHDFWFKFSTVR